VSSEYERNMTLQVKVTSVETREILASASVAIENEPGLVRDALQPLRPGR